MFSRHGCDKRIIRRPNKSGDIYLSLFLTYIVFVKRTITWVLHIFICRTIIRHNIGVTPCIWSAHWRHYILAFDHSALLNGRAQTACGPVYINTRPVLHLRRFITPAGDSPSALVYNAVANSAVIKFSFTMVIINSTVDNPWHDTSGEIHPIYFILYIAFFKKSNYSGLQSYLMQDLKPPYWCKFEGRQKNFRLKKKDSGLISGSRGRYLP